jgi:hypothetical protein
MARRFWPDGRTIGSTIVVGGTPRQVVGVVADVSMTIAERSRRVMGLHALLAEPRRDRFEDCGSHRLAILQRPSPS